VIEASILGAFKMLLMVAGGFVLLRFIGQLMQAKRNMEAERAMNFNTRKVQEEREEKRNKFGKTNVIAKTPRTKSPSFSSNAAEDVDFEEIKD
jgi:hypothetical protein